MLKKITIGAFAILALATFSACDNGGGEAAGEKDIKKDTSECVEGMTCYVAPEPTPIPQPETPEPECTADADCESGKLCNNGKCEGVGGEDDGEGNENKDGGGGDGSADGESATMTSQNVQRLLMGKPRMLMAKLPNLMVINFPDANLKKAIKDAIKKVDPDFNKTDITVADCNKIETVIYFPPADDVEVNPDNGFCQSKPDATIKSLEGLQYCTGIKHLFLDCNQIVDISPLKGLTELKTLGLSSNQVEKIDALKELTKLEYLYLDFNQIDNINALKALTKLWKLELGGNQISDISVLANITELISLDLSYNNGIYDISPLVVNVENGGFDGPIFNQIVLYGITVTANMMADIQKLKDKGIAVNYDL